MLFVLIRLYLLRQLVHIAVHYHAHIAAPLRLLEQLLVLSLAPSHHRRQQLDAGALRQLQNLIYHLVHRLLLNLSAAFRAVRNPDSRIQKAKVVVNLRDSSNR